MDHPDARTLASTSLDDRLSTQQERELAIHLVACEDCKAFYESLGPMREALRGAASAGPSTTSLQRSIDRAVTILQGGADPGPLRPLVVEEEPTGEIAMPAQAESQEPVQESRNGTSSRLDEPAGAEQEAEATSSPSYDAVLAAPSPAAPPAPDPTSTAQAPDEPDDEPDDEPPPQAPVPAEAPLAVPVVHATASPAPGLPTIYDEPLDDLGYRAGSSDEPPRRGRWILAIVATLAVAIAAVVLIAQQDTVRDRLRPAAPAPAAIQASVQGAFDDLRSLEASYRITRLGLFRQPETERTVYVFTTGLEHGRVVYESPNTLREERTLEIGDQRLVRTTIVDRGDRILTVAEDTQQQAASDLTAPALGPPDGRLRGRLGVLDNPVGSAARLLVTSQDLQIVGQPMFADRETYHVRFSVTPSPFTRADSIDVLLDAEWFLPLRIERSLARDNAAAIGHPDLLSSEAIEAQYVGQDRLSTEIVELDIRSVNDVVLPGEFVLAMPEELTVQAADGRWSTSTRTGVGDEVPFDVLLPENLPPGFREAGFAVYTGSLQAWGPRGAFPAPDGVMQAAWSDGTSTVVMSQRRITTGQDRVTGSPLQGSGLPVQTEEVVRGGHRFHYGISAEAPPHVFGFVGDVYVTITGHVAREDLVRMFGSLAQAAEPAGGTDGPAAPADGQP